LGRAWWLHHYPICSQTERMVGIDFTPSYLADEKAPERIQAFYADQSSQVKFGVILRNPIKRMHSAFHFWKQGQGAELCSREDIEVEFQQYVTGMLAGVDPCGLLRSTDYAAQLQRYFDLFKPSQFTILLFKQISAPEENESTAISDLWQRLGLQGVPKIWDNETTDVGAPPEAPHINENSHPPLEEDLDVDTLAALELNISNTIGADGIAKVLTATDEMPLLAEYGGMDDVESVVQWIESNW